MAWKGVLDKIYLLIFVVGEETTPNIFFENCHHMICLQSLLWDQCLLSTAPVCGGVGAGGECDGWGGAGWRCSTCVTAVPAPAQPQPSPSPAPAQHQLTLPQLPSWWSPSPQQWSHMYSYPGTTSPYHRFSVPDTQPCFYPPFFPKGDMKGWRQILLFRFEREHSSFFPIPCSRPSFD